MITITTHISGNKRVGDFLLHLKRFGEKGNMNLINNVGRGIARSIKNRINLQSKYHHFPERDINLSTSIYSAVIDGKNGIVSSDLFYAPLVENGTKQNIVGKYNIPIHPKPQGGSIIWRRIPVHQATRGKHYFELGTSDYLNGSEIDEAVGNEITKIING